MPPLLLTNVEYVSLRLIRRFLFPKALTRIGRYVPYYRLNLSECQPEETYRLYAKWLAAAGRMLDGLRVIEVGSGATNAAGYALACAGAGRVWCVEPYAALDATQDSILGSRIAPRFGSSATELQARVLRCKSFDEIAAGSADLILSHSVLEHVDKPEVLFAQMKNALAAGGAMLHIVDYRDHFFKYPLHFLQFSKARWDRFLNPGDLPRWRLGQHRLALEHAGFNVHVLHREEDVSQFARIKPHISVDFDPQDPDIGVLQAVLYCEPCVQTRAKPKPGGQNSPSDAADD